MMKPFSVIILLIASIFISASVFANSLSMQLDTAAQLKIYAILGQKIVMDTVLEYDFLSRKKNIDVREAKKVIQLKNAKVKELLDDNYEIAYYIPYIDENNEPYCMVFSGDKNTQSITYTSKFKKKLLLTYNEISGFILEAMLNIESFDVAFYSVPFLGGSLTIAVIGVDGEQHIMPIEKGELAKFRAGKIYSQEEFAKQWNLAYQQNNHRLPIWLYGIAFALLCQLIVWPFRKLNQR